MFRTHHPIALSMLFLVVGCAQSLDGMDETRMASREYRVDAELSGDQPSELMNDQLSDVAWANRFFMTQIFDARWNPDGMTKDTESNNCGPASLAMVMTARGDLSVDLNAEVAIDHTRAMMTPSYPRLDASELLDGAHLYADQALACVDDDTRPVYFDDVQRHASIPHGIEQGGGEAVYGYSWEAMDTLSSQHGVRSRLVMRNDARSSLRRGEGLLTTYRPGAMVWGPGPGGSAGRKGAWRVAPRRSRAGRAA